MANFVLLYSGGSAGATEAERGKVMEAWGAWFGKLGDKPALGIERILQLLEHPVEARRK